MSKKAILVDFDCIHRKYDSAVQYVLDENPEIATYTRRAINEVYPDEFWSSPGNTQFRRLLGWLAHIKGLQNYPEVDSYHESGVLREKLEAVGKLAADAEETRALERLHEADFPPAAEYWISKDFIVIVYSEYSSRETMLSVIRNADMLGKIECARVQDSGERSWINEISDEYGLDLTDSFLISSSPFVARDARQQHSIKTAHLDRRWISSPYYEKERYLGLGKLTDIDPSPDKLPNRGGISCDDDLSIYIRKDHASIESTGDGGVLPRYLGSTPENDSVIAGVGRFSPFIRYGKTYIPLTEDDPHTINLARALELIEKKKVVDAARIIQEFPEEGIQVLNGRNGPYITNRRKKAKVPKECEPSSLTIEECKQLLREAPARGTRGK